MEIAAEEMYQRIYSVNPPENIEEFWGFKSQEELFDSVKEIMDDLEPKDEFGARRLKPSNELWNEPKEIVRFAKVGGAQWGSWTIESRGGRANSYNLARMDGSIESEESTIRARLSKRASPSVKEYVDETIILDPNPVHLSSSTGVFYTGRSEKSNQAIRPLLIKYHIDCPGQYYDPVNSVVLESFFMEKLAPLGLSPLVYYYSDSARRLPTEGGPGFKKIRGEIACFDSAGKIIPNHTPSLRYMVTEYMGESINEFVAPPGSGSSVLSFVNIMINLKIIIISVLIF
jgi:hypothetical protein